MFTAFNGHVSVWPVNVLFQYQTSYCTSLSPPFKFSIFRQLFLFTSWAFVASFFCFPYAYFNALRMFPLSAFATLHVSWLCFCSAYVAYILSCSSFFIFRWSHLPLRQFVLNFNSKWHSCRVEKYVIHHWDQLFTLPLLVITAPRLSWKAFKCYTFSFLPSFFLFFFKTF